MLYISVEWGLFFKVFLWKVILYLLLMWQIVYEFGDILEIYNLYVLLNDIISLIYLFCQIFMRLDLVRYYIECVRSLGYEVSKFMYWQLFVLFQDIGGFLVFIELVFINILFYIIIGIKGVLLQS